MKSNQKKIKIFLKALNKIERIRSKNNKNWMDVLRLAVKNAPNEAIRLMVEITKKDKQISDTFVSALKKNSKN
tara:strand:- start:282 stop:500 length:219 start_codon:yes stop_codon:yes gene_type:complete